MSTDSLVPALMLFTLVAGLAIAVVLLLRFMRKPQNRHPLAGKQERNIAQVIDETDADAAENSTTGGMNNIGPYSDHQNAR